MFKTGRDTTAAMPLMRGRSRANWDGSRRNNLKAGCARRYGGTWSNSDWVESVRTGAYREWMKKNYAERSELVSIDRYEDHSGTNNRLTCIALNALEEPKGDEIQFISFAGSSSQHCLDQNSCKGIFLVRCGLRSIGAIYRPATGLILSARAAAWITLPLFLGNAERETLSGNGPQP